MKDIKSFKKIINTKMNLNRNPPKENYDSAFTNLCGLLMFCEPYRFKDGGGFSRQSIRATIKELKNNNINALSKIFGNKGKFYKGKFESEAVFAHKSRKERIKVKTNENNKTIKSNEYSNNKRPKTYGGKNQTINFIESTKFNENDDSINDNVERIEKYADEISDNEDFDNEKLKNNYEEYDETEWENKFPPDKKKDDDGDDKIIINTSKNKISKKNKVKEKPYLPIKNLRNNKNKGVKTRQQTKNEDIDSKTNSENIKKIDHKPKKDINTMDSSKNKRKLLNRKRKPDKVNKNMKKEMDPQLKKKKFAEDN